MKHLILILSCSLLITANIGSMERGSNSLIPTKSKDPYVTFALEVLHNVPMPDHPRILDIGSGNGKIAARLIHNNLAKKVVGIDINREAIKKAKAMQTVLAFDSENQQYKKQLSFRKHDIQRPLSKKYRNRYDMVTFLSSLNWIENQEAAFKNALAAVKPGGIIVIAGCRTPNIQAPAPIFIALARLAEHEEWKDVLTPEVNQSLGTIHPGIDVDNLKAMVNEAKLKVVQFDPEYIHGAYLKNEKYFKKFLRSLAEPFPFFRALSAQRQNDFIQDLATEYLEDHPANRRGKIQYHTDKMVILVAQKEESL